MFTTSFVWSDVATLVAVICALIIVGALVVLFVFGKKQKVAHDGLELVEYLQAYPHAVVGAYVRGQRQEVKAQEFISTLMALAHEGVLSIVNKDDEEKLGLSLKEASSRDITCPIDTGALALLRSFYAEDGVVYLASAQERGKSNKEGIDTAYRSWKKTVQEEAQKSLSASKTVQNASSSLLVCGYVLILVGIAAGLLVDMTIMTLLLVTGIVALVIREVLKQNTNVERGSARRLYLWLNNIESHLSEVKENERLIPALLEYACLFAQADKLFKTLQDHLDVPLLAQKSEELDFWKKLKAALYTEDWHF